ncbi:MAG: GNAT family N-acetyltransferase [Opitutaceae bacterium]|nr:GNAT family N-acetyltransferase [Opitutaceae bacterium]
MNSPTMELRTGGLDRPEVIDLLAEHLRTLTAITPPESMHALNLDALHHPAVTFWSLWAGNEVLGCGALKELSPVHGEIKSMRTANAHLRTGVGRVVMQGIIAEAQRRGYRRLSLETGRTEYFRPAHRLYETFGFTLCGPFGDYQNDPNSAFMTKELGRSTATYIRPANLGDFDQLLVLFRQLWPTKTIVPGRLGTIFARVLATPYKRYFCAVDDAHVVGLGAVSFKDNLWQEGEIAYVEELVVREDQRRKGVGSLLLDHLVAQAEARGCLRIELDTAFHREAAHRFYERHGMQKRAFLFSRVLAEHQPA